MGAISPIVRVTFNDDYDIDARARVIGSVQQLVRSGDPIVFMADAGLDVSIEYPASRPNLTREQFCVRVIDRLLEAGEESTGPVIAWARYIASILPSEKE